MKIKYFNFKNLEVDPVKINCFYKFNRLTKFDQFNNNSNSFHHYQLYREDESKNKKRRSNQSLLASRAHEFEECDYKFGKLLHLFVFDFVLTSLFEQKLIYFKDKQRYMNIHSQLQQVFLTELKNRVLKFEKNNFDLVYQTVLNYLKNYMMIGIKTLVKKKLTGFNNTNIAQGDLQTGELIFIELNLKCLIFIKRFTIEKGKTLKITFNKEKQNILCGKKFFYDNNQTDSDSSSSQSSVNQTERISLITDPFTKKEDINVMLLQGLDKFLLKSEIQESTNTNPYVYNYQALTNFNFICDHEGNKCSHDFEIVGKVYILKSWYQSQPKKNIVFLRGFLSSMMKLYRFKHQIHFVFCKSKIGKGEEKHRIIDKHLVLLDFDALFMKFSVPDLSYRRKDNNKDLERYNFFLEDQKSFCDFYYTSYISIIPLVYEITLIFTKINNSLILDDIKGPIRFDRKIDFKIVLKRMRKYMNVVFKEFDKVFSFYDQFLEEKHKIYQQKVNQSRKKHKIKTYSLQELKDKIQQKSKSYIYEFCEEDIQIDEENKTEPRFLVRKSFDFRIFQRVTSKDNNLYFNNNFRLIYLFYDLKIFNLQNIFLLNDPMYSSQNYKKRTSSLQFGKKKFRIKIWDKINSPNQSKTQKYWKKIRKLIFGNISSKYKVKMFIACKMIFLRLETICSKYKIHLKIQSLISEFFLDMGLIFLPTNSKELDDILEMKPSEFEDQFILKTQVFSQKIMAENEQINFQVYNICMKMYHQDFDESSHFINFKKN